MIDQPAELLWEQGRIILRFLKLLCGSLGEVAAYRRAWRDQSVLLRRVDRRCWHCQFEPSADVGSELVCLCRQHLLLVAQYLRDHSFGLVLINPNFGHVPLPLRGAIPTTAPNLARRYGSTPLTMANVG